MASVASASQHTRQARAQYQQTIQSRRARPRSLAMSQERRPRYELLTDKVLRPPRNAASRSPSPAYSTASSDFSSGGSSSGQETTSSRTTDFDELYDVSDDDSAIVPIKCSNSIKALLSKNDIKRESLPSLVIPSPSAWPTIQKKQSGMADSIPPLPKLQLSPEVLRKLPTQNLRVPTVNSTPSLDDSIDSDEPASLSPSTPDRQARVQEANWDLPVQLTQEAMNTLQHLSPDFPPAEQGPIIEASPSQMQHNEMVECGLNISLIGPPPPPKDQKKPTLMTKGLKKTPSSEPVSAISVPSPGGFFESLDNPSKKTWSWSQYKAREPSTTTAECFYDVPWDVHIDQVKERVVELNDENDSEGPPTARQADFVQNRPRPTASLVIPGDRQYEYDEEYERKLHETASNNMSRTSLWLNAQEQYLSALKGSNPLNDTTSPPPRPDWMSPIETSPPAHKDLFSPSKKAVRFTEAPPSIKPKTPLTAIRDQPLAPGQSDPLFYFAFQHMLAHARPVDAHTLRHLRADALQAQRAHIPVTHRAQLLGRYAVSAPSKPDKDFGHLPSAPNDPATQKQREEVARIDRERKALQQISLAWWHLEGCKFLTGSSLLPRACTEALNTARAVGRTPRVLDFGGLPTADWGWAIALEHRDAKVYTAVVQPLKVNADEEDDHQGNHWSQHRCPSNHRALSISTPYSLPFPNGSFDVISARSLPALCRTVKPEPVTSPTSTTPASASAFDDFQFPFASDFGGANRGALPNPPVKKAQHYSDEYAATLAEIRRVLTPGGVLAYEFMDAEVSSYSPPTAPRKDSVISNQTTSSRSSKSKSLHSRSVEFAVALRQSQYDPCAGHRSTSRLVEAGFRKEDVKENWVELPIGGEEEGIGAIAEVVGGVKWERWILATRGEKGLEGVAGAVEEARRMKEGAGGWRVCMGVVRNW